MIPFKESLKTNDIIGLVIPDMEYDELLIKAAGLLCENYNKILYISINKPYEKLAGKFKNNKINLNKFYFIDCITRTARDAEQKENCCFVSSPRALDEIQTSVLDILKKQRIDAVLIDSPSALTTYYEHADVLRFMHLLMTKLIVLDCKGIFPFQKESAGMLRRSVEMFVDDVVYLSGGSGSSNANYVNPGLMLDEMILCMRKISLNIQLILAGIKNNTGIFS